MPPEVEGKRVKVDILGLRRMKLKHTLFWFPE
jgi:hypothetical protein